LTPLQRAWLSSGDQLREFRDPLAANACLAAFPRPSVERNSYTPPPCQRRLQFLVPCQWRLVRVSRVLVPPALLLQL